MNSGTFNISSKNDYSNQNLYPYTNKLYEKY